MSAWAHFSPLSVEVLWSIYQWAICDLSFVQ